MSKFLVLSVEGDLTAEAAVAGAQLATRGFEPREREDGLVPQRIHFVGIVEADYADDAVADVAASSGRLGRYAAVEVEVKQTDAIATDVE